MSKHYGQILERAIRRSGNSISDVARLLNINRRSVYNWFNQQQLKPELFYKIGHVINYDFSVDLPDLFTPEDFVKKPRLAVNFRGELLEENENNSSWKQKYIDLLERHNALLSGMVETEQQQKN
jgi:transcriptional regulator with XRE-family HTH domain